jgi:molecular chaperone GrpE
MQEARMDTKKPDDSLTGNENFASPDLENTVPDVNSADDENALPDGFPELTPEMAEQLEAFTKKLQRSDDLEREVADWKTRYLRLQQDFESYRNRTATDAQDARTKGEANAVEAVLPVYDALERGIQAGVKDPSTLIPGLQSVLENFVKSLETFGCEPVPGKGAPFDPHVHEAITVAPGETDDTVLEVFQAGFTLKGKLVRPARVVVSKRMN